MKGETIMAQKQPWTHAISDRLMDAQVIAKEAPNPDPRLLDALYETQVTLTQVHHEITETYDAMQTVANALRYGVQPKRLRAA
jgi:hypothetical protein